MKHVIPNLTPEEKRCVQEVESGAAHANANANRWRTGQDIGGHRQRIGGLKQKLQIEEQLDNRDAVRSTANSVLKQGGIEELFPASLVMLTEKAFQLSLSNDPTALQAAGRLLHTSPKPRKALAWSPPGSARRLRTNRSVARSPKWLFCTSVRLVPSAETKASAKIANSK